LDVEMKLENRIYRKSVIGAAPPVHYDPLVMIIDVAAWIIFGVGIYMLDFHVLWANSVAIIT